MNITNECKSDKKQKALFYASLFLAVIFTIVVVIMAVSTSDDTSGAINDSFKDDTYWYKITSEDAATVSINAYIGENQTGALIIPSYVTYGDKTYSVTALGPAAFNFCKGFTSLIIPNSITTISDSVFRGCSGFTGTLTIPNSVITIGDYAFQNCSGFTNSLVIPDSVETIGSYAFNDCGGAKFVVDGNNTAYKSVDGMLLNKDGSEVIVCPTGKTGLLTIPNGVRFIHPMAFDDCSNIMSVTIPKSVTLISDGAFANCGGTKFVVDNENASFRVVDNMLSNKNSTEIISCLTGRTGALNITGNITTIGKWAFSGCSGLEYVYISNGVKEIKNNAFSGCSSLTSLSIPNSITTIDQNAFVGITFYAEDGITVLSSNVANLAGHSFIGNTEKMVRGEYNYWTFYTSSNQTSGSVPRDGNTYHDGDTVMVLGNTGNLARDGYTFGGWSYNGTIYNAGDTVVIHDNITFTAVYNSTSTNSDNTVIIAISAVAIIAILSGIGYYFLKKH